VQGCGATLSLTHTLILYGEVGSLFRLGGEMKVKSSIQGAVGVRAVW